MDGVKLPANASKESSGTISELKSKKDKIQKKVKRLLKDQIDVITSYSIHYTKLYDKLPFDDPEDLNKIFNPEVFLKASNDKLV